MRHMPLCLAVPFVLACGTVGPSGPTIRVEGTVTAADDGTPVVGAEAVVWDFCFNDCTPPAQDITDASGGYSLSFVAVECTFMPGRIFVTHPDFFLATFGMIGPNLTCTEELQTFDVQLLRNPPEPVGI